jgi:hypothetical protein
MLPMIMLKLTLLGKPMRVTAVTRYLISGASFNRDSRLSLFIKEGLSSSASASTTFSNT